MPSSADFVLNKAIAQSAIARSHSQQFPFPIANHSIKVQAGNAASSIGSETKERNSHSVYVYRKMRKQATVGQVRCFLIPALLLFTSLSACNDPSLAIQFSIPEDYQEYVSSVLVSVVVPPLGSPFDCEDIAFGLVQNDVVRANTVDELRMRGSEARGALDTIPRKGSKLLVAYAYDSEGLEVVAGCQPYSDIEGQERVEIAGKPVSVASIPPYDPSLLPRRTAPVLVTDTHGQSLAEVEVRWIQSAAGGDLFEASALSDSQGIVLVEVPVVPLPGPVAIDVLARWARSEPPVIVGYRPASLLHEGESPDNENGLRPVSESYQVGRIGPNGEMGVAVMGGRDQGEGARVYLAYWDSTLSVFVESTSERLPPAAIALGLLYSEERDLVISMSTNAILEILPNGGTQSTPLVGMPYPLVRRFISLHDCEEPGRNQRFLTVFLDGTSAEIDETGVVANSPFASDNAPGVALSSGCLSNGGKLHRVVSYAIGNATLGLISEIDVLRSGELIVVSGGFSFTPALPGEESLLLATTLDVEGANIVRYRMRPVGEEGLEMEIVDSDATLTFAESTGAGDFDGDGIRDVAAILKITEDSEASNFRIHTSLGLQGVSGRVAGLSEEYRGKKPMLFVADFNGDGHDDMLIASEGAFQILSMGAP